MVAAPRSRSRRGTFPRLCFTLDYALDESARGIRAAPWWSIFSGRLNRFGRRCRPAPAAPHACALLLEAPGYLRSVEPDLQNIPYYRHRRESLQACITYLRSAVAARGIVYIDQGTALLFEFCIRGAVSSKQRDSRFIDRSPFCVAWREWGIWSAPREKDIAKFWRAHRLDPRYPLWVVDGGFKINLKKSKSLSGFQGSQIVFRNPEPRADG